MINYREILRLHCLGLNKTEIASSLPCAAAPWTQRCPAEGIAMRRPSSP